MKPAQRTNELNQFLSALNNGADNQKSIENDHCVDPPMGCGQPIQGFKDENSKKEYLMHRLMPLISFIC